MKIPDLKTRLMFKTITFFSRIQVQQGVYEFFRHFYQNLPIKK